MPILKPSISSLWSKSSKVFFPIQIILFVIDAFVPDMVPVVDELFMLIAIINRIKKYVVISNFVRKHKFLTILLLIAVVTGIVFIVRWIIGIIVG